MTRSYNDKKNIAIKTTVKRHLWHVLLMKLVQSLLHLAVEMHTIR